MSDTEPLFSLVRRAAVHWLIEHSKLVRRYVRWRFKRRMKRMERAMGKALMPTLATTAAEIKQWLEEHHGA